MSQTSTASATAPHTLAAHQAPPPPPATLPTTSRTGPLRNGNPRGNPNLAPRCGAKSSTTGCPCRAPAMPNGRCRLHGGKSTGPRTAEGLANLARARTTHGNSTFAARNAYHHERIVARRGRVLAAAMDLRPYLPADIRTRFDLGADDLAAPKYPVQPPRAPTPATPPCPVAPVTTAPQAHGRTIPRDPRGRFAAPPQPPLSATKAERAAARAERALLAPWRAGIKRARMIRRLLTLQAQNASRAQHAQPAPPTLPPPAGSESVAVPHRDAPLPSAERFALADRNAIHRETPPHPAGPCQNPDKTSMQRGTVAPPAEPREATRQTPVKTLMQRDTVASPAGPGAADATSVKTLMQPDTVGPPAAPGEATDKTSVKTSMQRGTVHPGKNPFRHALEASTVCNTPEAQKLAAQVERAGGWPVLMAIDAARQAGQDWRSAAAAVRRRLAQDADQRRVLDIVRPAPVV